MRKILNVTHISLDGVMERMEDWHFDYVTDPGLNDDFWDSLKDCDALLLGRRTYEGFAAAWPSDTGRVADKLNTMQKYVVSTTLTEPAWNNTIVWSDDLEERAARLKAEPGGDVMTYGFGPLAKALLGRGLLDELHIGVNPVLAGQGNLAEMLIREGVEARLELVATRTLESGVIMLAYRPRP